MHRLMNACFAADPELRRSLYDDPRAIYSVAAEECFGTHRSLYFVQVSQVEIITEDKVTLGIVLAACHLACVAPRLPTGNENNGSECHICSYRESNCRPVPEKPALTKMGPASVRTWIQNRAQSDMTFREQLIASPSAAWTMIVAELDLPICHPLNKIRTIHLFVESAETVGFVLNFDRESSAIIPDISTR